MSTSVVTGTDAIIVLDITPFADAQKHRNQRNDKEEVRSEN